MKDEKNLDFSELKGMHLTFDETPKTGLYYRVAAKFVDRIPKLRFDPEWEVEILPPYGGAMMRFMVFSYGRRVSVFCDFFWQLGYFGLGADSHDTPIPYWEMYPRTYRRNSILDGTVTLEKDIMRFPLDKTEELMKQIRLELEGEAYEDRQ